MAARSTFHRRNEFRRRGFSEHGSLPVFELACYAVGRAMPAEQGFSSRSTKTGAGERIRTDSISLEG